MKRILHISKYYYPFLGGTEAIARDAVLALKGRYQQKVICFNHEDTDDISDSWSLVDDVEVIRCGCEGKISSQSLSISYRRILRETFEDFDPDYVLFHYPNPFVASILLKEQRRAKLILYWHLDIVRQKLLRKLFVGQNLRLLNLAERIIVTSPNYIEGSRFLTLARNKCVVIPNCIDNEYLKTSERDQAEAERIRNYFQGKVLCLSVGRHVPYKGFEYLIDAARLCDDRFQFFITGRGELTEKLHERAKGDPKIHFTGMVSEHQLKALYLAADIFCFSSITKNEAFGVALAEAMYYGLPAVTFSIRGSGVNYVSLDQRTGIEVPNRDVRAYAEGVKKLGEDPALREEMGKAGRQRVMENFLYESFQERIRDLFRSLEESGAN